MQILHLTLNIQTKSYQENSSSLKRIIKKEKVMTNMVFVSQFIISYQNIIISREREKRIIIRRISMEAPSFSKWGGIFLSFVCLFLLLSLVRVGPTRAAAAAPPATRTSSPKRNH